MYTSSQKGGFGCMRLQNSLHDVGGGGGGGTKGKCDDLWLRLQRLRRGMRKL